MSSDIYCAEQIQIPPTFPHILKLYAKAAIRTQPYDLLQWTCAYFRAFANCEVPPVKERLEYPPFSHPSGITPGYLKTLLNVFGHVESVRLSKLLERWQGIALPEATLFRLLLVGKFLSEKECHFYKFLAIACGFLGKNLLETMIYVCELLTEEPEGGSTMIPLPTFMLLYEFLAKLDCSGECPCAIIEEDTEELYRPCRLPSTEESSTLDSRLLLVSSGTVEEEEREAVTTTMDVCQFTSSDSGSSSALQSLKDLSGGDAKDSEIIEAPRSEQRVLPLTRELEKQESPSEIASDFQFMDTDYTDYDRDDDSYFRYGAEEAREPYKEPSEEIDDYQPIGLESILHGICECLEPVRESDRAPTPPPPDPFEEFLKRMKQEVEEDRIELRFRVDGIGPPVPENYITAVGVWLADCARRQEGLVGPRNIKHFLCPDLEDCNRNDYVN